MVQFQQGSQARPCTENHLICEGSVLPGGKNLHYVAAMTVKTSGPCKGQKSGQDKGRFESRKAIENTCASRALLLGEVMIALLILC